jgi:hypothetical protein
MPPIFQYGGIDEARYVTTRRYVTNCYIPYHEWRRYVTKMFLLHSVAIRGTLCNNIVTYRARAAPFPHDYGRKENT